MSKAWLIYEQAARVVLEHLREHLGLTSVEGKQELPGKSGTSWEIDAKAIQEQDDRFLVVEVRRHTTGRLKQEHIAALAFRIGEVGAAGGIVVTPLPLQRGAELVARASGIEHVRLSPESTATDYLAEYMGRRFIGASIEERASADSTQEATVIKASRGDA